MSAPTAGTWVDAFAAGSPAIDRGAAGARLEGVARITRGRDATVDAGPGRAAAADPLQPGAIPRRSHA